jgi:hypothetical protein
MLTVSAGLLSLLFLFFAACSDDNSVNGSEGSNENSGPSWEGEWLKFSAYQASIEFVKESHPSRSGDRFSNPSGRSGFLFDQQGDSVYMTKGYTFEYLFGAEGYVWGAAQNSPTENVYVFTCTMQYDGEGEWSLLNIGLIQAGDYIRDTRHD